MNNTSFYGGQPGFSFIIVEKYLTIKEMVANFKKGPDYTAVHFDEHVLINTENKGDPDNGKIFRRGYDYTNEMGGAIYVGQIVGPPGHAPMLELTTIEEVKKKQVAEGFEDRYSEGSYTPSNNALVPGKKDDGTFNDKIEWACCCVRDENGHDSTAWIGFRIPYLVMEFSAKTVDSYYNRSDLTANFYNRDLIDRIDNKAHPFYEKFDIKIPKGIKGDTLKNFKIIPASNVIQDYAGKADDVAHNRMVMVYDYLHYDKLSTGEPVTLFLGDYNMIKEITLKDDGSFTIKYTHDDDKVFDKIFKWIKEITFDEETGHLEIIFNQETDKNGNPTKIIKDLCWVKDISFEDNGTVTFDYTCKDDKVLEKFIKWIKEVKLNEENGHFYIKFNFDTDKTGLPTIYENDLCWVKDIELAADGTVSLIYTCKDKKDLDQKIKWIEDIEILEDGSIKFIYNTKEELRIDKILKLIKNIEIQTADESGNPGTGDQRVKVTYITGEDEVIGEPLNYIMETVLTSDYHYIVYYSDPALRAKYVTEGKGYSYNGKDDWTDLGSVKDESGILIGLNLYLEDNPVLEDKSQAIEYLNTQYPSGLRGIDLEGKVITIGSRGKSKDIYAFNYTFDDTGNYKGWYFLGNFDSSGAANQTILVSKDSPTDSSLADKKANLSPGGIWFVLS